MSIYQWRLAFERELLETMPPEKPESSTDGKPSKKSQDEQAYHLELEQRLERARHKIQALELLIEQAEKEFKIPIKKKSGTKRSPK